jgi:hypothetical protein
MSNNKIERTLILTKCYNTESIMPINLEIKTNVIHDL